MRPIRHILVLLDGTLAGEACLPPTLDLAVRNGARVTLVAARDPHFPERFDTSTRPALRVPGDDLAADLSVYLDTVRRRIAREHPTFASVEGVVLDGPVAETLAEYAARAPADVVAVTRIGSAVGVGRLVDALVARSDVAVLLVPPADERTPPITVFRHALVPVGWTMSGAPGSDTALSVLGNAGVTYTVLGVGPPLLEPMPGRIATQEADEINAPQREWTEHDCAEAERPLREKGADVRRLVRFARVPIQAVLEAVKEVGADLIVVASCRQTPGLRALFGTAAGELVVSRRVAVLVRHVGARDADGRFRDVFWRRPEVFASMV